MTAHDSNLPPGATPATSTVIGDTPLQGIITYSVNEGNRTWHRIADDYFVVQFAPARGPVRVRTDIKPGSDPNSINLGDRGVVPVAILTVTPQQADNQFGVLDATLLRPSDIRMVDAADIQTMFLAGAAPIRSAIEDVDGDGDVDLLLIFRTEDLANDGLFDASTTAARLYGPAVPGQPTLTIRGEDSVRIVAAPTGFKITGRVNFALDAPVTTASQLNMRSIIGPTTIRLQDGNYRTYIQSRDFSNNVNIISLTSADGSNWTPDPGIRIQHGSAGQPDEEAGEPMAYYGPGGKYYMAYTGRQSAGENSLLHKIIVAISDDGLNWTKTNSVYADPQATDGFASSADVISIGGVYNMYYTGGRKIVRAVSTDSLSWTRQEVVLPAGHDSTTVLLNGTYYMFAKMPAALFYPTGPVDMEEDELMMAVSADGVNWSSNLHRVVVKGPDGSEIANRELQDPAAIVLADGSLRVYLNNYRGLGIISIRPTGGLPHPGAP